MRRFILIILIVLSMSTFCYPQWAQTDGPTSSANVSGLFQHDSQLFAATSCGYFSTSELAARWNLNAALPYYSYTVKGDSLFVSVAYDFTPGSGSGIKLIDLAHPDNPPVDLNPLEARALAHSDSCLYAGSLYEGFLKSNDNGVSWNSFNHGLYVNQLYQYSVHSIEVSDNYIYAGTEYGVFRNTPDLAHWVIIKPGELSGSNAIIKEIHDTLYVAIGKELYRSYNYGNDWNLYFTAPSRVTSLLKKDNSFYLTTASNGILFSDNNGTSWNPLNAGLTDLHVNTISFFDTTLVCGTNSEGMFYFQGNQWMKNNSGINCSSIRSIAVTSNGLAANDLKNVYFSGNGTTWNEISPDVPYNNFISVVSMGDTIFLSVQYYTLATPTYLNFIVYSPDNGNTWNNLLSSVPFVRDDGYNLYCSDSRLYAWEDEFMYYTDNVGLSWTNIGLDSLYQWLHSFTGFSVYNSVPIATTDGVDLRFVKWKANSSWILSDNGLPSNSSIGNITFCEGALFVTAYGGVYVSVDMGENWTNACDESMADFFRINDFAGYGTNLFIATEKGVYFTSNYGKNWFKWNDGLKNTFVTSIKILKDTLYVGTKGNGIWKQAISSIPLSIPDRPTTNNQVRIYPNPSSDFIRLQDYESFPAFITIYDMVGKRILSRELISNSDIDISGIKNGAYLVSIQSDDHLFKTCKLIINR